MGIIKNLFGKKNLKNYVLKVQVVDDQGNAYYALKIDATGYSKKQVADEAIKRFHLKVTDVIINRKG